MMVLMPVTASPGGVCASAATSASTTCSGSQGGCSTLHDGARNWGLLLLVRLMRVQSRRSALAGSTDKAHNLPDMLSWPLGAMVGKLACRGR